MIALGIIGILLLPGLLWRWWRRRSRSTQRRSAMVFMVAVLLGFQSFLGAPAFAAARDCAPEAERPASGLVGTIDPAPIGTGTAGSVYDEVGYAGLVWHNFNPDCGNPISSVNSTPQVIDTWIGNEAFNVAKIMVATTNTLHYIILDGSLKPLLDNIVNNGTRILYNTIFVPFVGLAALLLGIYIFRHVWQGDLASVGKRGLWALLGLWFASITYLTPASMNVVDSLIVSGTTQIQNGFLQGTSSRNGLPTELHDQIVYQNWLLGQLGSNDPAQPSANAAQTTGRNLLRSQAFTKQEVAAGKTDTSAVDAKKDQYVTIDSQLGSAQPYSRGVVGSRTGVGAMALLQGIFYSLFQLFAKASILVAQVLLQLLVLFGPVIGLCAVLMQGVLRRVAQAAATVLFNVFILAVLAGVHLMVLNLLFAADISQVMRMVLAALVTVIFLMIGRPIHRLWQMVEQSITVAGGNLSPAQSSTFGRIFRRGVSKDSTPQTAFWDNVRQSASDSPSVHSQIRAEAPSALMAVRAQRLDQTSALPSVASATQATHRSTALPGRTDSDYSSYGQVVDGLVVASQLKGNAGAPAERSGPNSARGPIFSPKRGIVVLDRASDSAERLALPSGTKG